MTEWNNEITKDEKWNNELKGPEPETDSEPIERKE